MKAPSATILAVVFVSSPSAIVGPEAARGQCVEDGLIAYWTLDEKDIDGDRVIDVVGGNDGVIHGILDVMEGVCGEGLSFMGDGSYVELPALGSFPECSLECWAMAEVLGGGIQGIVSTWQWSAGKVHFKFESSQIQVHKNDGVKITYPAVAGEWYHIVYTTNTGTNELKLYVNGELVATGASGTTPELWTERRIGSEHDGRYLRGMVDEVRLYDRVLDEDEVRMNYDEGCCGCAPGPCPCGVRAVRDGDAVLLSWKPNVQAANSVDISRNGTTIADDAPFSPPSYRDATAPPGRLRYVLGFQYAGGVCPPMAVEYDACISNLRARCGSGGVALTWANNFRYAGIEVRRDGELLATLAGDATSHADRPPPGTFTYSVVPTDGTCDPATLADFAVPGEDDVTPWISQDIGDTLCGGIALVGDGEYDLYGSGADIWGTADAFRFAYQEVEGDFAIVARIDSIANTNAWAKAGLMARASLDANSAYAFIHLTPAPGGNGIDFQFRAAAGASAAQRGQSGDGSFSFPYYVRLARICGTFVGSHSADRIAWVDHGSRAISMPDRILVGMALTSHDAALLSSAEFREVALERIDICPTGIACACDPATGYVTVTWSNHPEIAYARIRVYRRDATGTEKRIASIAGTLETYVDQATAGLPAGTLTYRLAPVVGATECAGCSRTAEIGWSGTGCGGAGPIFHRGDVDGSGGLTIGDAIFLLNYQFAQGPVPPCLDACDTDDNENLTIGDPIFLLTYMFAGGAAPGPPGPPPNPCGADPAGDALGCQSYPAAACR